MSQENNGGNNVVDATDKFKQRERDGIDKLMMNPCIHGLNNIVFMVKNDGASLDIYQKPSADSPFEQWSLMGSQKLDQMMYHILLQASILEQKIFMLRDKYEPDTINMELPASFGVPTGVDKDGNPTGYTEVYNSDPKPEQ
jgi:hypothetical protein